FLIGRLSVDGETRSEKGRAEQIDDQPVFDAEHNLCSPLAIDRIYKINRIGFLLPHPVNPVNPVYFHRFKASLIASRTTPEKMVGQTGGLPGFPERPY